MSEKQNPKDYLVVRVQVVAVHKGTFGFKEEVKGFRVVIPNTREEAANLGGMLFHICDDASRKLDLVKP